MATPKQAPRGAYLSPCESPQAYMLTPRESPSTYRDTPDYLSPREPHQQTYLSPRNDPYLSPQPSPQSYLSSPTLTYASSWASATPPYSEYPPTPPYHPPTPPYHPPTPPQWAPFLTALPAPPAPPAADLARSRKKRHLTVPSDTTFRCDIFQCGKHFTRLSNLNTHLETHRPDRPRPHLCAKSACGKRFVRRSDLTRHTQCVHEKKKLFVCVLCKNKFARKDTLWRHADDGCPKRLDVVSRNGRNRPLVVQSQALSLAEYHRSQQALQEYYSVGAGEAFEEHYAEDEDEEEQQQEDVQKSVWGGQ